MQKGISKNVPHTFIQHGVRHYTLLRKVKTITESGKKVSAYNLYIFDQFGYSFLQMTHTTRAFALHFGDGILRERQILEVDDPQWQCFPNVQADKWIDDSPDRGYALEVIREGLGLNLEYLTGTFMGEGVDASQPEGGSQ